VPGKTVPGLTVITRDYPNVHKMFTSIGPLLRESTIGVKGAVWKPAPELELLGKKLHRVTEPGISYGMPSLQRSEDVADAILALAPETNGSAAVRAWEQLEKRSGLDLTHLSEGKEAVRIDFVVKPTRMMGGYAYMAYDSNYYGST
jgi:nitrate reductase alpha subunit